jgi:hypothetical protein
MRFYVVDGAGHPVCHVTIATRNHRPERVSRLSLEVPTELGLIEQFARQLSSLAATGQGEAVLTGLWS